MNSQWPTLDEIKQNRIDIDKFIHKTPLLTCESLNELTGANLYFKCENFQKTGSFKVRGAMTAVTQVLKSEQAKDVKGFTTHSSGNHGAALAYASKMMNQNCTIVMPNNSSQTKQKNVKIHKAEIQLCEPNDKSRQENCKQISEEKSYTIVPPYDNLLVIKGQASCVLEIYEDLKDQVIDYIITPVGGGGLLSGSALSSKYLSPNTKVIGAEPELAGDAKQSFQTGIRQPQFPPKTVCDGLRTALGEIPFEIIKNKVDDIITVSDEQVVEAMHLIINRLKIIIEPSCAVPLAVILANKEMFKGKTVAMVITGGNLDVRDMHVVFEQYGKQ